jgi:hypothetical protein
MFLEKYVAIYNFHLFFCFLGGRFSEVLDALDNINLPSKCMRLSRGGLEGAWYFCFQAKTLSTDSSVEKKLMQSAARLGLATSDFTSLSYK